MREYVGPTLSPMEVAFVPGDPPGLAAAGYTAGYVWLGEDPVPVSRPWDNAVRTGGPLLTVSPDGRWVIMGPANELMCFDRLALPSVPLLAAPAALAIEFTGTPDRVTVVHVDHQRRRLVLGASEVRLSAHASSVHSTWFRVPAELDDQVRSVDPFMWPHTCSLSADGLQVVWAPPRARAVLIWAINGEPPRVVSMRGNPHIVLFSPDGRLLAIDGGTSLYVHDAISLELATKWRVPNRDEVFGSGLAWSPDGRLLARTNGSTTFRVYEAATGRQVTALGKKPGSLTCVAFSPDGLTLATGTHLGPVRVWDVE